MVVAAVVMVLLPDCWTQFEIGMEKILVVTTVVMQVLLLLVLNESVAATNNKRL